MFWDILDGRYLERPLDWGAFFGRKAPLMLEIGFGRGGHLVHLAKLHPDKNLIGSEVSRPSLKKASRKVKNHDLPNVRVIEGAGALLLWVNIAPQSLCELHVNFPDPWHKEGHQRRRLINDRFLHLAATRMLPGAPLYIATDHPDYQPVVTECLERTPYFNSRLDSTFTLVDDERFRTKYELKAMAEGRICQYYKWERNETPAPNIFTIPEELAMPHAVVTAPIHINDVSEKFAPFQQSNDDESVIVRFLGAYQSSHNATTLVETYITQDPQHQRIGFAITERDPHEFIVQLHDIGFPRPTDGVHFAASCLANWLTTLHPEAQLIRHNLMLDSNQLVKE